MVGLVSRRRVLGAVPFAAFGLAGRGRVALAAPGSLLQADLAEDQTLRLASYAIPAILRPANEGGPLRMMTQNTFLPPYYEDETGALVPGLCSEWSVSDDGLVYTLTVDSRARFSDGSPVTAADLKFSWEYLTWPETQSPRASLLTGPVVGYDDVVNGVSQELAGLEAVDEATLRITLVEPNTPYLKIMAGFYAGVVQRANVLSGENWDETPVCCGPYRLESWDKAAGELSWVINEHWWGPAPTISRVTYRAIEDPNVLGIVYDNDEIDVAQPTDILATQLRSGSHAEEMYLIPYSGLFYFHVDATRAPMEDVNVRRALLKASDMGTIVQAVFLGGSTAAFGINSPNLAWYSDLPPYFDPDGARAALAASTYGAADNLPPISLRVPTNQTDYIRVAEALQQMWQEILGVEFTISLRAQGEDPDDGISQLFRLSLGTLYNDSGVMASGLGLSTNVLMQTYVKAKNEELDALLIEANRLPVAQEAERIRLFQQAEQILMDQAYYIPIIWAEFFNAVKPWVTGLKSNSSLSLYTLPEMSIAAH